MCTSMGASPVLAPMELLQALSTDGSCMSKLVNFSLTTMASIWAIV